MNYNIEVVGIIAETGGVNRWLEEDVPGGDGYPINNGDIRQLTDAIVRSLTGRERLPRTNVITNGVNLTSLAFADQDGVFAFANIIARVTANV